MYIVTIIANKIGINSQKCDILLKGDSMKKDRNKSTNGFKTAEVVTLVLITCVVSLLMGYIISKPHKTEVYEVADENLQNFIKQYNYIINNYYEDVDQEKILEAALEGMINALGDPYSNYLDETQATNFNNELNGAYNGIGIEITKKDNQITVVKVFSDSPAALSGLEVGDSLVNINGKSTEDMSTSDVVSTIKSIDTKFQMQIKRNEEIKNVSINKENITLSSVTSEIINQDNHKIGYLSVSIFALNTYEQFKTNLTELENNNIDSLIIDLRGNSGGHLTSVEDMISLFLDKGKVIYQMEEKSKVTKYYSKGTITKKYPIVVLIDGESASASEMMAAALKESYGATLIGTNSYGKGTVQELQDSKGSQYKITTKKWLTPKGNWVNKTGLQPDLEVKQSDEYLISPTKENDAQLSEAIKLLLK